MASLVVEAGSVLNSDGLPVAPGVGSFALELHNACISIKSRKTGEHRTIRIRTQPDDVDFFPGRRLVELLVGADNTSDYRAFGYVYGDRVVLWKKHRGSPVFEFLAAALANPARYEHIAEFFIEARCRRCSRLLTDPESIATGLGPTCREFE